MGTFNTVMTQASCPQCKAAGPFDVQYKFGDTWQYQYRIGDKIQWGGNDQGKPGHHKVAAEGIGDCPHCHEYVEFDVIITEDIIVELMPVGLIREHPSSDGYTILEE